jgi:hypothetical protein
MPADYCSFDAAPPLNEYYSPSADEPPDLLATHMTHRLRRSQSRIAVVSGKTLVSPIAS